ncbi:STAS domain-containing protein [Streptomyces sp. NPDC051219]|uniref:STAS domain-containing protein n=1 Tax=Streptomyces sp. NPDC051219 TaxID=3155283 RepID=UPI0034259987
MPIPHLTIYRHDRKTRALITLAGEIDLHTGPLVRESLACYLRDCIRTIDVDLTPVTFCDVSGLNVFLAAWHHMAAAGGSLQLHHPPPVLARIVDLTGSRFLLRGLPAPQELPPPREGTIATTPALRPAPRYEALHRLAPVIPAAVGGVL